MTPEVKGEFTFKLSRSKAGRTGACRRPYEVKTKAPLRKTSAGIMFMTKAGNLSVENERQPVLPGIRAVGPARARRGRRPREGRRSAMADMLTDAEAIIEAMKGMHGVAVLDEADLPGGGPR